MATEYKLSYTANDINTKLGKIDNLAEKSELPTKISDLITDASHRVVTDAEKTAWNDKQDKITGTAGDFVSIDDNNNVTTITAEDARTNLGITTPTVTFTTLTVEGWTDNGDGRYAQTIDVSNVTANSAIVLVDVALTGTDLEADAAALGAWCPEDGSGPSS